MANVLTFLGQMLSEPERQSKRKLIKPMYFLCNEDWHMTIIVQNNMLILQVMIFW